jgi:hypothetical protein
LLLLLLLLLQHEIAHGTKLHECEHRFKDTIINAQKPLSVNLTVIMAKYKGRADAASWRDDQCTNMRLTAAAIL